MAAPASAHRAIEAIRLRAEAARQASEHRWRRALGDGDAARMAWDGGIAGGGRLTVNFHPDRTCRDGSTVAAALARSGRYDSQWLTGLSSGSRSAVPGGDRHRFESHLFAGAYHDADPANEPFPVYGALDLLGDPHGGSPRFGSCYFVLRRHVLERTTLCVGDSHQHPEDVGTLDAPWPVLAALAEQAAAGRLLDRTAGTAELLTALHTEARSPGPSRSLDGYVEAQVHGGVQLDDDLAAVVLDPSFQGTETERHLATVCARSGAALEWHGGSQLPVDDVPADVRGPTMPRLAREVAPDGTLVARLIGDAARRTELHPPQPGGDEPDHPLQQLKYLWHVLLLRGSDVPR